jgi:hypothetical protein
LDLGFRKILLGEDHLMRLAVSDEISSYWKTKSRVQTASYRAEVSSIMFLDMCIPFLRGVKAFIEPFAMNARALEQIHAIIFLNRGADCSIRIIALQEISYSHEVCVKIIRQYSFRIRDHGVQQNMH